MNRHTFEEIGCGQSHNISDQTTSVAIKVADKKQGAREFVRLVEQVVSDVERGLIQHRYISRNHNYINDYKVYEEKIFVSAKTYRT